MISEVTALQKGTARASRNYVRFFGDENYLRAGQKVQPDSLMEIIRRSKTASEWYGPSKQICWKQLKRMARRPSLRHRLKSTILTGTMFAPILKS